jgi:hypothetical protein
MKLRKNWSIMNIVGLIKLENFNLN